MALLKLILIACFTFLCFGVVLLLALIRKQRRKAQCHERNEGRCHNCSCDRF